MGCIPLRTKGMVLEMAKAGDRGFIQLRTRAAREVLGREWGAPARSWPRQAGWRSETTNFPSLLAFIFPTVKLEC